MNFPSDIPADDRHRWVLKRIGCGLISLGNKEQRTIASGSGRSSCRLISLGKKNSCRVGEGEVVFFDSWTK